MWDTLKNLNFFNTEKGPRANYSLRGSKDPYVQEQFRALRAKLTEKVDSQKIKVIGITSSIAGEGKTVSALNLGTSMASAGEKRVLLIDADLRKSDTSRILDLHGHPGLGELISEKVELKSVLRNSIVPGLWIIPSGKYESEPSDLFSQDRFKKIIKGIGVHFDIILIDTSPILPVSDTVCMKDVVDAFVLVFRTKYTPHTMLEQAVEKIGEGKILGVVLNCLEPLDQRYCSKYYANGQKWGRR